MPNNPTEQIFWGRIPLETASACYHFRKKGGVQNMMHKFKYKGIYEVGLYVGKKYGQELLNNNIFKTVDIIVPIPLHRSKLKIRGYNQSEIFGKGLSEGLEKPMDTKNFLRIVATETQTKKSRINRWDNVNEIFKVIDSAQFENKHVLLIDDIITTGATIEAAGQILLEVKGIKLSVAGMAITSN